MSFYSAWTPYLKKQKEEIYKRTFGRTSVPPVGSKEAIQIEEFNSLTEEVKRKYIEGNIII